MHYIDEGAGPTLVLLHGNPTSSYLWRNVIPELKGYRVVAPDLIGMGKSEKPDIPYRFADHAAYVSEFINSLGLENVTLVMHDWGGGVGLDYAVRNAANVRGLIFMEAVMRPMDWSEAGMVERYLFGKFRDEKSGFKVVARDNYFVEKLLPMMSGRDLSDEEMAAYRAPYPTVESRLPVAQWPKEIPISGEPADNTQRIGRNYGWLETAEVPVMLLYAEPGMIINEAYREGLEEDIPRITMKSIGSGLHYIQEVQPSRIGREIANWVADL